MEEDDQPNCPNKLETNLNTIQTADALHQNDTDQLDQEKQKLNTDLNSSQTADALNQNDTDQLDQEKQRLNIDLNPSQTADESHQSDRDQLDQEKQRLDTDLNPSQTADESHQSDTDQLDQKKQRLDTDLNPSQTADALNKNDKDQLDQENNEKVEGSNIMLTNNNENSSRDSVTNAEGDESSPDNSNESNSENNRILFTEEFTADEEAQDQYFRTTLEKFLQPYPCFKLRTHDIPRCRECSQRQGPIASRGVYCRFYQFRRIQYNTEGNLIVAGFPNPFTEPTREDLNIWQPDADTEPTVGIIDIQVCRYVLLHVGDQFCYLWSQESEALKLHSNPNDTIAWKKAVQGIREICDVCDTTLFNFHWTCERCGFGVCINCFKDRKENHIRKNTLLSEAQQRKRDEFNWLLCGAGQKHELSKLMLTQIIAGNSLNVLGQMLHDVRLIWEIPQLCGCSLSKHPYPNDTDLPIFVKELIEESKMERIKKPTISASNGKPINGDSSEIKAKRIKKEQNQNLEEDEITHAFDKFEHINFLRKGLSGLRRFLPTRSMTLSVSSTIAPDVPHEWLCDGRLLRLTNPSHPNNYLLFQEVWKCGQPVMISNVAQSLNLELWRPEAFCRDFGDKPNDLINCLTGNLVPNQPMRHFWEGFQCITRRLLDANGQPMLLKLKDWPPGDDFAEILPTRYADLMNGLPMPEYTLRTGNLNMASCLPKMFVPPDLGPKMYNAYGSALHPEKGTTNLHLDISDAVNIMVYVGVPEDTNKVKQQAATHRAIVMGGCEFLTRNRVVDTKVLPGALWHIFAARDADKIRDLLNRVTLEKGFRLEPDHDPIHDQNWYLDDKLRERLFKEYGVQSYPIVQCLGDAVFIPAGAPHQVQNLYNCIKVAEDFVSPENITHCYHLTHEFRNLSHSHTNHEDKLQIKNIIYHSIKDCCTILQRALESRIDEEIQKAECQLDVINRKYSK